MNGSGLELNKIETHVVERNAAGGMWKETIQKALYTCEEPAACKLCCRLATAVEHVA